MKHEQNHPFDENVSSEVVQTARQEQIIRLLQDIGFVPSDYAAKKTSESNDET